MMGLLFESLCVRDLRVYAHARSATLTHYRDSSGLEVDAIVELREGRWAAFEIKLGSSNSIEQAARSLRRKVAESRAAELCSLNAITAGATGYTRPDGVNVVALGHLSA